jgi:serine acetyltransferase
MYGVTLGNNIIVASGSVVCDSFTDEKIIIGGNPARIIGTWDKLEAKSQGYMMTRADFREALAGGDETKFINRKVKRLK